MSDFPPPVAPPVTAPAPPVGLPAGVAYASPWLRLGGYILDAILITVTFGIGWLIWAAFTARNGQTPAKKILGMRVIRTSTLQPVGLVFMVVMRALFAGLVAAVLIPITLGIILLMPLWDKRNQNIWDKVSGSVVVTDPHDAWAIAG